MLGIALGTSASDGILVRGVYYFSSLGETNWGGSPLYMSTSAGLITSTAPSNGGDIVRVIGYGISSRKFYFTPDNTWVELAT